MKFSLVVASLALTIPQIAANSILSSLARRLPWWNTVETLLNRRDQYCENTASSRTCWGDYSIEDDWYVTTPDTGVTREYWLVAQNTTLAPDVRNFLFSFGI